MKLNHKARVYTVSELNAEVRYLMEGNFRHIWLSGEISNLVQVQSGHLYFSVKDEKAQVRCVMFRLRNQALDFTPKNGIQVLIQVQVSLYEPRGDYQLIVGYMEEMQEGALRRKFEELKKKLAGEGLFNREHKQNLPPLPQSIGLITSLQGAVIHDVINILKRRFANIPIIVYPTAVQGKEAITQIAQAIALANEHAQCDVLILARGGGSIEDLWSFNEEVVARAIFASKIPIVSAIGHESDVTIADLVADVRASTPSAAAEILSPNIADYVASFANLKSKLLHIMRLKILNRRLMLDNLRLQLQHPVSKLQNYVQTVDYLEQRLYMEMQTILQKAKTSLEKLSYSLEAISPLSTLHRGYAVVSKNNKVIRDVNQVAIGDKIDVRLANGSLNCEVVAK